MLAGLGLFLVGAGQAPASTLQCGDVVTHDIVLEANLLDCPGDGLVATGADITIDLNHHRIAGTGAGAGVRVLASEVTLRDGRITGFQDGVLVEADGLEEARVARLEISDNRRGVVLAGGFPPSQSGDGVVTVSWSTIHHNENSAMLASLWPHRTQVTGSRIEANGSGLIFRDSRGGTVVGNSITANGLAGLGFDFSPGGRATGNLISRTARGGSRPTGPADS